MRRRVVALLVFALSGVMACVAHSHDGTTQCSDLAELCHAFDDGGFAEAIECHAVGHRGSATECAAVWPKCRALCRYYDPFCGYNPTLLDSDGGDAAVSSCADVGDAVGDSP